MRLAFVPALLVMAACGSGPVALVERMPDGVDFGLADGTFGAHHAEGSPPATGPVLDSEFAVALADSLGGLAIISHSPRSDGRSDLFVLQLNVRDTGTFACGGIASPCHGRLLVGVQPNGFGLPELHLEIRSGSLTLTRVGPDRVRGTLQAVLAPRDDDGDGPTVEIEDGTIDVPYSAPASTSGALACLRGYTGTNPLPAACR